MCKLVLEINQSNEIDLILTLMPDRNRNAYYLCIFWVKFLSNFILQFTPLFEKKKTNIHIVKIQTVSNDLWWEVNHFTLVQFLYPTQPLTSFFWWWVGILPYCIELDSHTFTQYVFGCVLLPVVHLRGCSISLDRIMSFFWISPRYSQEITVYFSLFIDIQVFSSLILTI